MEFEIKGERYSVSKMDAFKQFHVSRRLAPVLSGLAASAAGGKTDFSAFLQPIAEAVAAMPDADCDYVLHACLAVTRRKQGDAWVPVYNAGNKALMFDDIDLAAMLTIATKAIEENLGGFFLGAADKLNAKAQATA